MTLSSLDASVPPPEVVAAFLGSMRDPAAAVGRVEGVLSVSGVDVAFADRLTVHVNSRLAALKSLGYAGLGVGLSGGLDSLLAAHLAVRAAPDAAFAATVRLGDPAEEDGIRSIAATAREIGIPYFVLDGRGVKAALAAACPGEGAWYGINLDTRVVQAVLFQWADTRQIAMVATTDRSETLLGRFTEHFYGHIAPLSCLYKTEAWRLAEVLGVSGQVNDTRPGCREHWYDDMILGADYSVVDPVLHLLADRGLSPSEIEKRYLPGESTWLVRVARRIQLQTHRTEPWLVPPPGPRNRQGAAGGGG